MEAGWIDALVGLKLQFKPGTDSDVSDRLNYLFSSGLFLFIGFLVGAKQYLGNPITCWMPAEFTGFWEEYAEQLCYVNSTYWIREGDEIPVEQIRRLGTTISYYQWTPWVLAVQAVIFYLPHLVWKLTNWKSGIFHGVIVRFLLIYVYSTSPRVRAHPYTKISNCKMPVQFQMENIFPSRFSL